MRVVLDATPLLGRPTGVGRTVQGLLAGLAELAAAGCDVPDPGLATFTWRGHGELPPVPRGHAVGRRVPARLLHEAWARGPVPPVEWLVGRSDVVHATNFVLPPTRRAAGTVMVHDLTFLRHPEWCTPEVRRYAALVPRSVSRAALVLAPSETTADDIAEAFGLGRDRVRATPLGVDPAWARARAADPDWLRRRGLPERYLLFVGAREPRKGLGTLVAAHADARAQQGEAVPPLVLAGPAGWGDTGLPADGPHADVLLAGYLADEELRSLVAGAAALAFPSRYEGFGLPPLEALACGTPVVASDLPVLREVTGGLARLVPVGDTDAWAAALLATLADPGPAEPRQAWARRWTWRRTADATCEAWAEAAGGHARRR
jgi:glycosyltransferase involved in cell wall biosynthesis